MTEFWVFSFNNPDVVAELWSSPYHWVHCFIPLLFLLPIWKGFSIWDWYCLISLISRLVLMISHWYQGPSWCLNPISRLRQALFSHSSTSSLPLRSWICKHSKVIKVMRMVMMMVMRIGMLMFTWRHSAKEWDCRCLWHLYLPRIQPEGIKSSWGDARMEKLW